MKLNPHTMMTKFASGSFAALLISGAPAGAQNIVAPIALEQTAPAIPVEQSAIAAASGDNLEAPAPAEKTQAPVAKPAEIVQDYTEQIGSGLKERERRLTLLNEAMMKLREAGETEDAMRVEERIHALLSMPAPSQANAQVRAELDKMRARNDELIVQMVAMEEELKRYRGNGGSASLASRKR